MLYTANIDYHGAQIFVDPRAIALRAHALSQHYVICIDAFKCVPSQATEVVC